MLDRRLPLDFDALTRIAAKYPTPFYLYDESAIRRRTQELYQAFAWNPGFREYFAVKATPNPTIVRIFQNEGCGLDCASLAELELGRRLGITGESIMFTSNNTTLDEFQVAAQLGAIINLDTPELIDRLMQLSDPPKLVSFRYNPGPEVAGNQIIGNPAESKFGCTKSQILAAYERCRQLGFTRFGLHAMLVSNELSLDALLGNAAILFELATQIQAETKVSVEFVNLGGGIGVAYRPNQEPVDLAAFGQGVRALHEKILAPRGLGKVRVLMENGRTLTGPYGYLVSRVINRKTTYKTYVGVDACMSNLMRPGMYGAYHHISTLPERSTAKLETVDVVGSLCENNDKLAIDRELPSSQVGDLLIVHDAGAHGYAMGFQYNGRLRCAELLLRADGQVQQIRRAETIDDYFNTVRDFFP